VNLLNLIAAPLIASTFTLPPARALDPAELWTAGVDLTAAELSSLLEDCTGYRVDADTDADGDPAFYIVDPSGERLEPDYPYPDLETVADVVGWRIDEALADR
jgi:hypothetical protein|tara:strand:- start:614 stop:922 length:309 start_codon:yes stop_codon:yes gene_type:complete